MKNEFIDTEETLGLGDSPRITFIFKDGTIRHVNLPADWPGEALLIFDACWREGYFCWPDMVPPNHPWCRGRYDFVILNGSTLYSRPCCPWWLLTWFWLKWWLGTPWRSIARRVRHWRAKRRGELPF